MRRSIFILGFATTAVLALPASAQTPLDRTDPTQEEEREREEEESRPDRPLPVEKQPQPDQQVPEQSYPVGPIVIEGASKVPVAEFTEITERYGARTLSAGEIEALANEVADLVRSRGYIFATALIEPQTMPAGVLRIRLDEGIIDQIRIEGHDDPAIRAQLAPLINGRPVTLARLERQLLLAGDLSGVYIRNTSYERQRDLGILVVEASRSRARGAIELENDGSRAVGPERARIDADFNGLLSPRDEVDLTYSTTPFQPSELQYGAARYRIVVNRSGTELGLSGSYSATNPGAYLADRDVFGRSWRVGLEARHPLKRSRDLSIWAEAEFQLRDLRQERMEELARHDRIPVLRAGLFSVARAAGGRLRSRLAFSQGLDLFGATERGDPLATRNDASAVFSSLYAWYDWERDLPSDFSITLAGRAQLSADPLLSTEDLGLGGSSFLRGYNYSERSGDEGVMGSGELRYDWANPAGLFRSMQVYAYADGGVVGNLADGRGGGSLASAGGGMRTDLTRDLDLDLEVAVPLTGPRYDTDDASPRFNVRIRQAL